MSTTKIKFKTNDKKKKQSFKFYKKDVFRAECFALQHITI